MKKINIFSTLFFANIFFVFGTIEASAFDYPVGIPDAWIAPDMPAPSAPSPWTDQIEGYYYIDNSVTCLDNSTTNPYGSPSLPKCRIPTSLAAGSYVEIHGGPYNWTNVVYIRSYGTELNPVWIIGKPNNELQMSLVLHGTYMYVDGINTTQGKSLSARSYNGIAPNYVMIRNSTVTGTASNTDSSAVQMYGEATAPAANIIAYNNNISYMGSLEREVGVEADRFAFITVSYISNVWILDNVTHHNRGDGVQFSHGGKEAHHFYYGRNLSYEEGENCVDIKVADDVIISENTCYGIKKVGTAFGECMVVHYFPSRIWFINNEIYDCNDGIVSTGANDVHIIGNYIHSAEETPNESHGSVSSYRTGSGIRLNGTRGIHIYNNTIHNTSMGVSVEVPNDVGEYPYIGVKGNIITNSKIGETTGNQPFAIMLKGSDFALGADVDYNILHNPATTYVHGGPYETIEALQIGSGKCPNCISDDPLLISVPTDMRLQSTSPAKDSAFVPQISIDKMMAYYGLSLDTDIAGVTRPQNALWDIGAYEYMENNSFRADVDNSSQITTTDALLTLRNSLGLSMTGTAWQTSATTGDVNCDGVSNSTDALLILRYSLGLSMSETGWCE